MEVGIEAEFIAEVRDKAKVQQLEEKQEQAVTRADVDATVETVLRDADKQSKLFAMEGFTAGWTDGHFMLGSSDGNFKIMPMVTFQLHRTGVILIIIFAVVLAVLLVAAGYIAGAAHVRDAQAVATPITPQPADANRLSCQMFAAFRAARLGVIGSCKQIKIALRAVRMIADAFSARAQPQQHQSQRHRQ